MNIRQPILVLALVLLPVTPLLGHSRLVRPPARTSTDQGTQDLLDGGGLNFDVPCGENSAIPPVSPPAVMWFAGADQTVTLQHHVLHGGERYQFFVSFDAGTTFDEVSVPQTADGGAITYQQSGVPATAPGMVNIRIGLPSTVGTAILRYTDGDYFSCADILLIADTPLFSDGFESGDTQSWSPPL